jgi:type IV fimbrial biogenesis protein FimT
MRGLTLIELLIAMVISALMLMTAAPYFSDYIANARLRENGNLLLSEALMAQSEAVKRNNRVRLSVSSGTIQVLDASTATPVVLRTRNFTGGVVASSTASVDFMGDGRIATWPNGVSVALSGAGVVCSDTLRCPQLMIDAGGAIRLCGNQLSCS